MQIITQPMVPYVVRINIEKHTIFHRPDEAMLFVMVNTCLHLKNILLLRTLNDVICLINGYKQNEKSPPKNPLLSFSP